MMIGFATVTMAGQLSRDPELRYFFDGTPCVNFCVTVHRANGNGQSKTFVECKRAGDKAEETAAGYKKGDAVRIEGILLMDYWRGDVKGPGRLVVDVASMEIIQPAVKA